MKEAEGSSEVWMGVSCWGVGDVMYGSRSRGEGEAVADKAEVFRVRGMVEAGVESQPRVVSSLVIRRRIMLSGTREPAFMVDSAFIPRGVRFRTLSRTWDEMLVYDLRYWSRVMRGDWRPKGIEQ